MLLIEKGNQVSEHSEIKTSDKIEPKIINKNPLPTPKKIKGPLDYLDLLWLSLKLNAYVVISLKGRQHDINHP